MVPGSTLTTLPSVTIGASVGMAGEWVAVGLRFVSNQTRVHSLTENERLIQQFRLTPRICWNMNDHLVLITSFLDRCNLCSNRAHELDSARCKCATLGGYHFGKKVRRTGLRASLQLFMPRSACNSPSLPTRVRPFLPPEAGRKLYALDVIAAA